MDIPGYVDGIRARALGILCIISRFASSFSIPPPSCTPISIFNCSVRWRFFNNFSCLCFLFYFWIYCRLYAELGPGERISLAKYASEHHSRTRRRLRIAVDASIWPIQVQSGKDITNLLLLPLPLPLSPLPLPPPRISPLLLAPPHIIEGTI